MAEKQILIVAGEPSGDLIASKLIKAIRELDPSVQFTGLGGELMRKEGTKTYFDIKEFSVLGLIDVISKINKFIYLKNFLVKKIKEIRPCAIILVDFSGFNLRLAKSINNSIPVIYYVSPQVWASRKGRIKTIKKYISKIIVLFKFERDFYKKHGIDAEYAGHPLIDAVKYTTNKTEFFNKHNLNADKKTILLMPGSRKSEISNILPIMSDVCFKIKNQFPKAQFIIAKPKNLELMLYEKILKNRINDFKVIEDSAYDSINAADFCLVASGTATIETTLMLKPFVIIYKMASLNYLLYRPQVKVPFIGMVNIVAGKKVVPEFVQHNTRPKPIADYIIYALNNPTIIKQMTDDLSQVKSLLGDAGASKKAARIILDYINSLSKNS